MSMERTRGVWVDGESRREVREKNAVIYELGRLVDEGLLLMGVTSEGEACYWPTPLGCVVLGMSMT